MRGTLLDVVLALAAMVGILFLVFSEHNGPAVGRRPGHRKRHVEYWEKGQRRV